MKHLRGNFITEGVDWLKECLSKCYSGMLKVSSTVLAKKDVDSIQTNYIDNKGTKKIRLQALVNKA